MSLKTSCLLYVLVATLLSSCATRSSGYFNADEGRPEFFGFNNECDALVAWVWQLKSQFPTLTARKANEKIRIHDYKHLFNDDNFIPTFGSPYDKLGKSQKKSIARALQQPKKCKNADETQLEYFKGLYTNQFLPRVFNTKSTSLPDQELVQDHAVKRRAVLSSVGVELGQKPSSVQLVELAKKNATVFDLLWPSERALIENEFSAADFSGDSTAKHELVGSWFGNVLCQNGNARVTVVVKALPGRITGQMKAGSRQYDFILSPRENGLYLISGGNQQLGQMLKVIRRGDLGALVEMNPSRGCGRILMARFEPIDSLGGYYGSASNQREFCSQVIVPWLDEQAEGQETAELLQIELYPLLNDFKPSVSARQTVFSPSVLEEVFGIGIGSLSKAERMLLAKQIYTCLLLDEKLLEHNAASSLYDARVVRAARQNVYTNSQLTDVSLGQTSAYRSFVENGVRPETQTSTTDALFPGWRSTALGPMARSDLEKLVRDNANQLVSYDPFELKHLLEPITVTLNQLRLAERYKNTEQQREKYRRMFASIKIPYNDIPSPFSRQIRLLANGEPITLDSESLLFYGGYASHALEHCKTNLESAKRLTLSEFLLNSWLRAGVGGNFSDPNFSSALAGQSLLSRGRAMSKLIDCAAAEPILTFLIDVIESSRESADGRPSFFVRSCAPSLSESKCRCLANAGEAALPSINKMRYTRAFIPEIISRNPIAGARIIAQCGIVNY